MRKQITAIHLASVKSSGVRRQLQTEKERGTKGFTKKLSSHNKGVCKVILDPKTSTRIRVSVNYVHKD